jgi:hypothetical protein
MAFTGNHLTISFKKELLEGAHNFGPGGNTFRLALYTSAASLDANTTAYSPSNEISETGSYVAGGVVLVPLGPATQGSSGVVSFQNAVISGGTFTARGGLVYNADTGASVAVLDFGAERVSSGQTFEVQFAPISSLAALVQIR